jgi:hypothetical protein
VWGESPCRGFVSLRRGGGPICPVLSSVRCGTYRNTTSPRRLSCKSSNRARLLVPDASAFCVVEHNSLVALPPLCAPYLWTCFISSWSSIARETVWIGLRCKGNTFPALLITGLEILSRAQLHTWLQGGLLPPSSVAASQGTLLFLSLGVPLSPQQVTIRIWISV